MPKRSLQSPDTEPAILSVEAMAESATRPSSENTPKPKRTLNPDNAIATVANLMSSATVLAEAAIKPSIPTALREKIFLAVTSVNDCRYCKWGHTHWAMAQGVPLDEVNLILGHETKALEAQNPAEAAAILFAQHYAENLDQIDPGSVKNLHSYYSDAQVAEILAYVRFITFTNLTGNTVDTFFDRFRGNVLEGIVGVVAAPFALLLTQLASFDRRVGMDPIQPNRRETPPPTGTSAEHQRSPREPHV